MNSATPEKEKVDKTEKGFRRMAWMKDNHKSGRVIFYISKGEVRSVEVVETI